MAGRVACPDVVWLHPPETAAATATSGDVTIARAITITRTNSMGRGPLCAVLARIEFISAKLK
jgi:hypothetical protein